MKNEVKASIKNIILAKEQKRLVIFVGAGVSLNSGIPNWGQLIAKLKEQISLSDEGTDHLKIAQLFYNLRGRKEYYDFIQKTLLHQKAAHNPINEAILALNPQHIITTNYDDLFEQLIKRDRLQYDLIRQDSDLPKSMLSTYLIKMHGCFETQNIVLTEDDYLKYSENFPLIESYIKSLFASRLVLFVGFSFSDINLKYILQRVDSVLGEDKQPSYIYFDGEASDLEKDYLRKKKIFPIYFGEIKEYLDEKRVKNDSNLTEIGNKLFRFLKIIEKPTFRQEEIEELSIANQIRESLKPFKGFDFIMPTVIASIWPFKEENENWTRAVYSKLVAKRLTIENPKLIEFFKNLTRFGEGQNEIRPIKTLAKLKQETKGDICAKIKEVTNNLAKTEREYEELIECVQLLNHSFISYINREYDIRVEEDVFQKCNCLSCRYGRFEFDEIVKILEKVAFKNEDISRSNNELKNRLLKGYTAAKMGLVKIAYDELQRAVDLAINQNDEVSYFLAKYNLKHLVSLLEISHKEYDFYEKLHDTIDLKDLLNGLKVEEEVRDELEKIIYEKYLYDYIDNARRMREKIIETYNLFSNGGGTTGSYEDNIHILINKLLIVHSFYRTNRILDTEFDLFSKFTEICFESIIYNFVTPLGRKPPFDKYPKIEEFDASILQSVILYCSPTKLHEILKKLGEKKIKMTDEGRRNFVLSVTNFFKSFYTKRFGDVSGNDAVLNYVRNHFFTSNKFQNLFQNIILLLGHVELPDSEFKKTIEPFLNSLSVHNFRIFNNDIYWKSYLSENISKFEEPQQVKLLQIILREPEQVADLVELFSNAIHKQGKILFRDIEFIKPYLQKENRNGMKILYYLYPISDENIKTLISENIRNKLNENFHSLYFYEALSLKILEPSSFLREAIDEAKTLVQEGFDVDDFSLSNFLHYVGHNNIDTRQGDLQVFSDTCPYIKWLFHFEAFDYERFDNEWFDYSPTLTFLPKMSNNSQMSSRFREYLKENHKSEYYFELLKIYFESFSDDKTRQNKTQ